MIHHSPTSLLTLLLALVLLGAPAQAQQAPAPVKAPESPRGPAATTATFGDWIHRCVRVQDADSCEVYQQINGVTAPQRAASMLATVAVGSVAPGEPLQVTVALPVNLTLTTAPRLTFADGAAFDFPFARCAGTVCFATYADTDRLVRRLKAETAATAKFEYRTAANTPLLVPVSLKGFDEAYDALVKSRQR